MIITFETNSGQADFKVDKNYRIKDVLKILSENTVLKCDFDLQYVTSVRKNQKINVLYTFNEAGLFNGDTLIVGM